MTISYEVMEAYREKYDHAIWDIWNRACKATDKDRYPWTTLPLTRVKKIWRDYVRAGVVRDERGLNDIADEIVDKIVKIDVMTMLSGHSHEDPEIILKDMVLMMEVKWDQKAFDRIYGGEFLNDENGGYRLSDYGLKPLQELAAKILSTMVPEERILLIDQVFNVCHQRSDLASWFVKGGRNALDELSNQEA